MDLSIFNLMIEFFENFLENYLAITLRKISMLHNHFIIFTARSKIINSKILQSMKELIRILIYF